MWNPFKSQEEKELDQLERSILNLIEKGTAKGFLKALIIDGKIQFFIGDRKPKTFNGRLLQKQFLSILPLLNKLQLVTPCDPHN